MGFFPLLFAGTCALPHPIYLSLEKGANSWKETKKNRKLHFPVQAGAVTFRNAFGMGVMNLNAHWLCALASVKMKVTENQFVLKGNFAGEIPRP